MKLVPSWITRDPVQTYYGLEKVVSPRLEQALRTDAAMDAITVGLAVRRIVGRTAVGVTNGLVEAVGLPSSRQVRRLQRSLDELQRGAR